MKKLSLLIVSFLAISIYSMEESQFKPLEDSIRKCASGDQNACKKVEKDVLKYYSKLCTYKNFSGIGKMRNPAFSENYNLFAHEICPVLNDGLKLLILKKEAQKAEAKK